MKLLWILIASTTALVPLGAGAQVLTFPSGAHRTADQVEPLSSYQIPVGPWHDDKITTIATTGKITRQAWQFQANGQTTLQLLSPLRQQLVDAGFEILYECEAQTCGGFDFRYATDVLPEPGMHVDLGNFRFVSARRQGSDGPEYVSLMISRTTERCFVQLTRVGPAETLDQAALAVSTKSPEPVIGDGATDQIAAPLGSLLESDGHAVLGDLIFQSNSSKLGKGNFRSLAELADYLSKNPDRSVVLVGHTDAKGGLSGNIALSKKRAQAVKTALIQDFGVSARQVDAQGVGYLAPIASNLTDDGRSKNRRVEVILTSTK